MAICIFIYLSTKQSVYSTRIRTSAERKNLSGSGGARELIIMTLVHRWVVCVNGDMVINPTFYVDNWISTTQNPQQWLIKASPIFIHINNEPIDDTINLCRTCRTWVFYIHSIIGTPAALERVNEIILMLFISQYYVFPNEPTTLLGRIITRKIANYCRDFVYLVYPSGPLWWIERLRMQFSPNQFTFIHQISQTDAPV